MAVGGGSGGGGRSGNDGGRAGRATTAVRRAGSDMVGLHSATCSSLLIQISHIDKIQRGAAALAVSRRRSHRRPPAPSATLHPRRGHDQPPCGARPGVGAPPPDLTSLGQGRHSKARRVAVAVSASPRACRGGWPRAFGERTADDIKAASFGVVDLSRLFRGFRFNW
ncbi:hypothetical protein ZWY2020_009247 [Hordeum vulgare]|nr:hypothetical protein ZWY2020_009247 [Hordeum vulgare]